MDRSVCPTARRHSGGMAPQRFGTALIFGLLLLSLGVPAAAQSPCQDIRLDIDGNGVVNNVDQGICFGCRPDSDDGCWEYCALWDLDNDGTVGFSDVGQITLDCPKWPEVFEPIKTKLRPPTPSQSPTPTPDATPSDADLDLTATPGTATATPRSTPTATVTPARTRRATPDATPDVTPVAPAPPPDSGSGALLALAAVGALALLGVLGYIRWWRARWL